MEINLYRYRFKAARGFALLDAYGFITHGGSAFLSVQEQAANGYGVSDHAR